MDFENLFLELTLFLRLIVDIFVRPFVPIWKQVSLVIYRLTQSFSYKVMDNLYRYEKSIIKKYTLIIYRVFSSQDGSFRIYIYAPN